MRRVVIFLLVLASISACAQSRARTGIVVKMTTVSCTLPRGFMASMAGVQPGAAVECAEYTLVSDKVVYVMNARRAEDFLPLAEEITFQIRKNEVVILDEDEKRAHRFFVREMILRAEWDRRQELLRQADLLVQQAHGAHLTPRGSVVLDGR